jgi:hypothetical protein
VRGGIHLIDWFKVNEPGPNVEGEDDSSKFVAGPFISVRLPKRLALQFEGLRRRYEFKRSTSGLGVFTRHEEAGSAWEIPGLLIWRPDYQEEGWQPYIGAGPGLRYVTADAADIVRRPQLSPTAPPASETRTGSRYSETRPGAVGVAGMERALGPVVVSVELRYAFWTAPRRFADMPPNRNQVSILFGVRSR